MNQYKCKLFSLDKLPVGPMGVVEPLCNSCNTKDCSNPIEPTKITVFGRVVEWRIYKRQSNTPASVIQCDGYSAGK